jgi:arylsulfatase A-like enzyme
VSVDEPEAKAASSAPNIVLILTDDQRFDSLWAMPSIKQRIFDRGMRFRNGFVVNPICCPSRASILTGKYSHSTGVYANGGPHGGWQTFQENNNDPSTMATWLDDAGYQTMLVGKYMQHYNDASYVPPGWDEWAGLLSSESDGKYYDYTLSVNGVPEYHGAGADNYSTDVFAEHAVEFIENADPSDPLMIYFSTLAPHAKAQPARRHRNAFKGIEIDRRRNYNERRVGDKPDYIQEMPPINESTERKFDRQLLNVHRSLLAVDEAFEAMWQAMKQAGRDNTMWVFISDNGHLWGEHRWKAKSVPYEESIRVPFAIRYDALVPRGADSDALALNIDLAPTFADAAGVAAPGADGESLLPVLADPDAPFRDDFLIEHVKFIKENNPDLVPTYCALRTADEKFVVYETGEREYYRLDKDPYEMKNRIGGLAKAKIDAFKARLLELCNPTPPGFPTAILT